MKKDKDSTENKKIVSNGEIQNLRYPPKIVMSYRMYAVDAIVFFYRCVAVVSYTAEADNKNDDKDKPEYT